MTDLPLINWGVAQIVIGPAHRVWSKAVHFKEDGTKDNRPSVAFLCEDDDGMRVVHEMSVETLGTALAKAGYRLVRGDS